VYYRGKASTNKDNIAKVTLPDYVSKIAREFTISVTPIGKIQSLSVSELENNSFYVYSQEPCSFFWHVYGLRVEIETEVAKDSVQLKGDGPYTYLQN
jgi:hypothetical protein